jgi:ATP-dependent Zn protease
MESRANSDEKQETLLWEDFENEVNGNIAKITVYRDYALIEKSDGLARLNIDSEDFRTRYAAIDNEYAKTIPVSYVGRNNLNLRKTLVTASIVLASSYLLLYVFRKTPFVKRLKNAFRLKKPKRTPEFAKVADITGMPEKRKLTEVMENLGQIEKLGGRAPKGFLLQGAPGTGKTMLARALANETGSKFYAVNASEFNKSLVGQGSEQIRNLVKKAKANAPAIVFIDEIDAIAKSRSVIGSASSHNERESTLNQLLTAIDGFQGSDGVTFVAATNRAELLDKALLRPGRFDRIVQINKPNAESRFAIIKNYLSKITLGTDKTVLAKNLVKKTANYTPAEIRNLVNEATINAATKKQNSVIASNFDAVLLNTQKQSSQNLKKNAQKIIAVLMPIIMKKLSAKA